MKNEAKDIPFTREYLNTLFRYREGKLYWIRSRRSALIGKEAGTVRPRGYRHVKLHGGYYLRHRLVYYMHTGEQPPVLDHKNGIPGDDRIENLQPITFAGNVRKRKIERNNTSGVSGVYWNKKQERWLAHIKKDWKDIHLGSFTHLFEAVAARKSAELTFWRDTCEFC